MDSDNGLPHSGTRLWFLVFQGLVVGLLALSLALLWTLKEQVTRLQALDSKLEAVAAQVSQQSALLGRAVGEIIPWKLPPKVEEEFSKFEQQLQNSSLTPTDAAAAQALFDQLAELVNGLPPWVQDDLLPRLVPRRWDLQGLQFLAAQAPRDLEPLVEFLERLESHYEARPAGAAERVSEALRGLIQKTGEALALAERADAVSLAKKAIAQKSEHESAMSKLGVYDDAEVLALIEQLREEAFAQSTLTAIASFETDFKRYGELEDSDLRDYALLRSKQALMDMKLRLASWGKSHTAVNERIAALDGAIEKATAELIQEKRQRHQETVRKYQLWALDQIRAVPRFKDEEERQLGKIASVVDRNYPLSEVRKTAVRTAQDVVADKMIEKLGPIDPRVLDDAVGQWFNKMYQRNLDALDEERQLRVTLGFANATKRPLEQLP